MGVVRTSIVDERIISERLTNRRALICVLSSHYAVDESTVPHNTALGSDGQGPQGFSFIFLELFDFFDLFAGLFADVFSILSVSRVFRIFCLLFLIF